MSNSDRNSLIAGLAFAGGIVAFFGVMVASVVSMSVRDGHERQAVREALQGDCAAAYRHTIKAGRVPSDASRLCPALIGEP